MENIQDIYPLSPMQQGMLFHTLYEPESGAYTEQISCRLNGRLNTSAFKQAWQEVMNRHDILRSAFVWEDVDEPLQIVHQDLEIPFSELDWSDLQKDEQNDKIQRFEIDSRKGFNLADAPLLNITIAKLDSTTNQLILNHHHLLLDGWCVPIVLSEVFKYYNAFDKNESIVLDRPRPYRDYIAWLQQQDMEQAKQFWKKRLIDISAPTPLAIKNARKPESSDYKIKTYTFDVDLSERLNAFAKDQQITLNTIMQGTWGILLARYNRLNDVVFGATVSGRPAEIQGIETMVGLFINTLPVRVSLTKNESYLDVLQKLQLQQAETRQFEYMPLVEIQGQSAIPRDLPLFESLFIFENYPVDEAIHQQKSELSISELNAFERTNYPLTLVSAPGKQLLIKAAFDTAIISEHSIENLFNHLSMLLRGLIENPNQDPNQISLLSEMEYDKVVNLWNDTNSTFPATTIHSCFEKVAIQSPDKTAIVFKDQKLSYAALNQKANQLAHFIINKGIKTEQTVALCLNRSFDMIIAGLAILKCGASYVPIDASYPIERIAYICKDSNAQLLISTSDLNQILPTENSIVFLDSESGAINSQNAVNPEVECSADNLAYIIYTSGSTGKPKGVMLQHYGFINTFIAQQTDFKVDSNSRLLQFASFSFDASICEIYLSLLSGAELHLVERETILSKAALCRTINESKITTITFPPSMLSIIADEDFPNLKTVVSVGEACSLELAEKWYKKTYFINGYGPTEATVGCVWGNVTHTDTNTFSTLIGKPIINDKIYILDNKYNPVPIGIAGDLYVFSPGLARGYINRPDLTAELFLPNPFSANKGDRLYRTGDLARWLPDGTIEFMGRADFQIKIRGNRIELGEIEASINKNPAVRQNIVLAVGENPETQQLAAYIITENESDLTSNDLKASLKSELPDYMIPNKYIFLDSFPLNSSGKIDRRALPQPDIDDLQNSKDYIAPKTPVEELLATLWADVLKVSRVGIKDNFFSLGGHSLLATQLISRIRDAFNVELAFKALFDEPTIENLAHHIENAKHQLATVPPIQVTDRNKDLDLSFAQQRLWFLDQLQPGKAFYNIPAAFKLSGDLKPILLEKSINAIIARHEILRTTFANKAGKPVQVIHPELLLKLEITDLSEEAKDSLQDKIKAITQKEANTPFNLASGPLLRVKLIKTSEIEHIILFTIHHIIADGWSMGILISEVAQLYEAYVHDSELNLPVFKIQYADYAVWQQSWLKDDVFDKLLGYWKAKIGLNPAVLELPIDKPRPAIQTFNGDSITRLLPQKLTKKIKEISTQHGVTLFMTLLGAFQTLLHRYSGQNSIILGSPVANRTHSETEKLIGFFVNNLVLKSTFDDDPEFADFLHQVRETTLEAYTHQDIPFEQLVDALITKREMSHSAIFQVMFVFQNLPQTTIKLPGLTMETIYEETQSSKFDMSVTMAETAEQLVMSFEYNTDLFEQKTIERMMLHFENLLSAVTDNPTITISEIDYISNDENQKIIVDWNNTFIEFDTDLCVQQKFAKCVADYPDHPALIYNDQELTYKELDERSNKLAHFLSKYNVESDEIIGICMDRSFEMIIGILGTLKAGAAFLPLDPDYPTDRLDFMISDSGLRLVLINDRLKTNAVFRDNPKLTKINLDKQWSEIEILKTDSLTLKISPDNLAYVIYTSGSTGKPKGTLLAHRGLINLANEQQKAFDINKTSRVLQFSSLSFDAAVWETVMALLNNATLCLVERETLTSGDKLVEILKEQKISTITLPPSVLAIFPEADLPDLKTIITAGEKCTKELIKAWTKNRRFYNAYGPTETTVCASMFLADLEAEYDPPIGKPIGNFQLYIVDAKGFIVPVGIPGELCIGGIGLARGYHNRPDLTAEKFIPNTFSGKSGERLYRSGDLVRFRPDGNIDFLGRIDQQVKIRGFRIEIGEIEAALRSVPNIVDVVVLAREDIPGDKRLVAYYVCTGEQKIAISEIRNLLKKSLPEYMVPAFFIDLNEMPLTANGKIDRSKLPAPEQDRSQTNVEYIAPRNENEKILSKIVSDLLHIEKVGVFDNFFELGGHSLLATQFMSRIREKFDIELPLLTLFEKPTIAELSDAVEIAIASGVKAKPQITKIDRIARTARRPVKRTE